MFKLQTRENSIHNCIGHNSQFKTKFALKRMPQAVFLICPTFMKFLRKMKLKYFSLKYKIVYSLKLII